MNFEEELGALRAELGAEAEVRHLPVGPGGPIHRRARNQETVEATRTAISRAIERLSRLEGKEGYPSADRIVSAGDGEFSRSRVFENLDLVDAAVDDWHRRETEAGRAIKRRKRARASSADTAEAEADAAAESEIRELKSKLKRALEEVMAVRKDNLRLKGENGELHRQIRRLGLGLYEKLWPRREFADPGRHNGSRPPSACRSTDITTDDA